MPKDLHIVEVCEPVFLYLCELNRLRREGISGNSSAVKFGAVRHRIEKLLTDCEQAGRASNHLEQQWKAIERPFNCFIDSMVEDIFGPRSGEEEALPAAMEWGEQRLAEQKFGIVNGNNEYFKYLQEDLGLKDNDEDARERLEFHYACLGLGFVGKYQGDPDGLAVCKQEVAGRVQHLLRGGADVVFAPQAYEHVNPARLNLQPEPVIWGVVLVTVAVLLFFFVATAWLYKDSARGLEKAVQVINTYGDNHPGLHP